MSKPEDIPMNLNSSEYYESVLQIHPKTWKNKKILDLGAGQGGTFEADLKRRGIDTNVISLSLHFADIKYTQLPPNLQGEKTTKVVGEALQLPFKDNSFDLVVSVLAVPFYLNSLIEFKKLLEEIRRVLKEGGEARLWPLSKAEGPDRVSWPKTELERIINDTGLKAEVKNPEAGFGKDGILGADAILVLYKVPVQ